MRARTIQVKILDRALARRQQLGGLRQAPDALLPLEASRPVPGSRMCAPRSRSRARFCCVAGCSYMRLFIAGAITSGQLAASALL